MFIGYMSLFERKKCEKQGIHTKSGKTALL